MGQQTVLLPSHALSKQGLTAPALLTEARAGRCQSIKVDLTRPSCAADIQHRSDLSLSGSILDASADCIKVLGLDGRILFMNESGRSAMEIETFEDVKGRRWVEFWPHDERPAVQAAMEVARLGGVGRFTAHGATAKGTPKWWDVLVTPMRDRSETVEHLLAVSRDVTAARHVADDRQLLNLELGHRIRNIFALVNGLITVAARAQPDSQPFASSLSDRFTA
jgi:PAS domain S-box-containing protein